MTSTRLSPDLAKPSGSAAVSGSRATWIVPAASVLLVLAFAAAAIYGGTYAYSPVPFWDMWDGYVGFYLRSLSDSSAWWAQHNEHRIVLSRLLFWADLHWFGGDGLILVVLNYILASALFGILAALAWSHRDLGTRTRWILAAVILSLSFAWTQKNNLTWGFQSQFFLAYLMPLASFVLLWRSNAASRHRDLYFLGALGAAILAAGSMANGVLAVSLLAVAVTMSRQGAERLLIAWGVAIAVTIAYLKGYHAPGGHGSVVTGLSTAPVAVVRYLLAYLGSPFAYIVDPAANGIWIATFAGAGVAVAATALSLRTLLAFGRRERRSVDRELALSMFLIYIGMSALALSASRHVFGLESAVSSRYTTPALLTLATVLVMGFPLLARMLPHWNKRALGLLFAIPLALIPEQLRALRPAPYEGFEKMMAALAVEMQVRDDPQLAWIFPNAAWLFQIAKPALDADVSIFGNPLIHDAGQTLGGKAMLQLPTCGGIGPAPTNMDQVTDFAKVQGALMAPKLPVRINKLIVVDASSRIVGRGLVAPADEPTPQTMGAPFRAYVLRDATPPLTVLAPEANCSLQLAR